MSETLVATDTSTPGVITIAGTGHGALVAAVEDFPTAVVFERRLFNLASVAPPPSATKWHASALEDLVEVQREAEADDEPIESSVTTFADELLERLADRVPMRPIISSDRGHLIVELRDRARRSALAIVLKGTEASCYWTVTGPSPWRTRFTNARDLLDDDGDLMQHLAKYFDLRERTWHQYQLPIR